MVTSFGFQSSSSACCFLEITSSNNPYANKSYFGVAISASLNLYIKVLISRSIPYGHEHEWYSTGATL